MKPQILATIICALFLCVCNLRAEGSAELKLDAALSNWQTTTPEMLRQPENAELVENIRAIATDGKNPNFRNAVVLLLKLGDPPRIRQCLEELRSDKPLVKLHARRLLLAAASQAIIPALAQDYLQREESTDTYFVGGEFSLNPISVDAAVIIQQAIIKSPVFKPEVRVWANAIRSNSGDFREQIRAWWKVNQAAMDRQDYQNVNQP